MTLLIIFQVKRFIIATAMQIYAKQSGFKALCPKKRVVNVSPLIYLGTSAPNGRTGIMPPNPVAGEEGSCVFAVVCPSRLLSSQSLHRSVSHENLGENTRPAEAKVLKGGRRGAGHGPLGEAADRLGADHRE